MKSFQSLFSESSAKPQNAFWARLINYTSFDHKTGKNIILFILVISYIEILSQSFNLVFQYIHNDQNDLSTTTQIIQRAFSFDDIFNYGYDDGILLLACCGILLYFLYLLVSFSMVVYSAYKFKKPPYMTQVVPTLLLVHALVLFYPIDNLCNRLHYESRVNNLSQINLNFGRNTIMIVSLLIGVINFILAVIPTFLLYHILPTYNPLSSRNYYTDQITFLQKTVISAVIKLILTSSDLPGVLLTADLLFSFIRQAWYFYSLPRYQITTFKLEGYCIILTTLLPLLTLVIFIINQIIDDPLTTATLIIVFLVLCATQVILVKYRLGQILRQILFRPVNVLGPYRALYKLMFLKYLVRNTHSLNERTAKVDLSYFYLSTASNCLKQLFSEFNSSHSLTNLETKEGRTLFKRMYLEHIISSFAKHDEFKFMLADLYSKNLKLHTLAIKILAKIRYCFSSFHVKASAELLFLKIQEHIMNQEQNNEAKINLSEFIAIRNEQECLQGEIKKQLDLHVKVWQEYSHSSTNLSELQRLAQLIDKQKLHIKKQWARIENRDGKNLSRLCLLYGQYQIVLNHSVENGLKYIKKHSLLYRRFDPAHPLNSSNFVDSDNFSVTFTTHQEKMGNIIHTSESIQNALGYQKNLLIGSSIGNLMTPYISERHNEWISDYIKTGHRTFMGQLQTVLVKNASGTLKKVSLFANIHPSLDQEVCLIGLFRLLEDPLEYILVTPEGEIDSYTERIGLKLGLQRKHAHIENICRDYEEIVGSREAAAKAVASPDSPEEEYFANADEKEGASPITREDFLLTSTNRHLLSSRTMTSPLAPRRGRNILFSQDTQADYKESNKEHKKEPLDHDQTPKMLKMSFNTYSLVPNKQSQVFSYDCTVATMSLRNDYLRVLAIEMIDENKLKERESVENISFDQRYEIDNNNTSKIRPTNSIHLHPAEALPNQVMSSSMSTGSTSQRRKATSTYLEEALNAKYYPKQMFTFLIIFAILVSPTFIIQGLFHAKTQTGLNKIYSLTITMNLASSRADTFSSLARHVRGAYYIRDQYLPPGLSVTNSTKSSFSAKLALLISTLSYTNSQLQSVIQGVDASFRKNFTDENIRMYDVNPDLTIGSYRTFNTFMATNVMISKISGLNKTYMTIPINDFHTIFHNSVNDLLISTINAVEVIYQEIQSFSDNMEYTLKVYQILSMILFLMRFAISCYFFYWVYTSEVALGQKFLVITPKQVALILHKLHNLDKSIEREEFEQFDHTDIEHNVPGPKAVNVRIDKNLKTSGLARQHWKRFLIYFILLNLLIGQTNFTFIQVTKGFANLNNQIDNLAKIEMSQYELTVLTCANSQVICNDFVTPIRNNDPIVELQADLASLQTMIESLMAAFTDEKGIVDPIVVPFFFGDACSLMSTSALRTSCLSMTNGAKEFGLLSLLSRHYTLFTTSYHNFQISNKTFPELQTLVVWSVTYLAPSLNVIRDLIISIMTQLNSNFVDNWNSTYHNAILVVSLNTCSLVIFCVLVIIFVHLYFFNYYNRFKGMLKVIPFDIILSNSTLKGVMIISSRKKMDRIKNRI